MAGPDTPTADAVDEIARVIEAYIAQANVPEDLWHHLGEPLYDRLVKLWLTDPDEAMRRFDAWRVFARAHWLPAMINRVFNPRRFTEAARRKGRAEEAAAPRPGVRPGLLRPDAMLDMFKDKYVHLVHAGTEWVLRVADEELLRVRAFVGAHPDKVMIGMRDNGSPVVEKAGQAFLEHPGRPLARGGLVFDPALEPGLRANTKLDENVYNTWTGFAMKPMAGDWSLMRTMMRDGLCGGDETSFNYQLNWLARLVQFPQLHGEVAVVLGGNEGVGKGTLGRVVLSWFGRHADHITQPGSIVGKFNHHLANKAFLFCDEVFFAGDRKAFSVLKALITEPTFMVEIKNGGIFSVPNRLNMMLAGNPEHLIQAGFDARRYLVLKALDWHKGDQVYWTSLNREIENGGAAAMLHDLRALDIKGFNHRAVPHTTALGEQKMLTQQHDPWGWWLSVLERGYVYKSVFGNEEVFHQWADFATTELLYESYQQWARALRLGKHEIRSRVRLGHFLASDVKLTPGRPRTAQIVGENPPRQIVGENTDSVRWMSRAPGYHLSELGEARAAYEHAMGVVAAWPPEAPEGDQGETQNDPGQSQSPLPEQGQFDYPEEPEK